MSLRDYFAAQALPIAHRMADGAALVVLARDLAAKAYEIDDTRFDELALKLDSLRETFRQIDNRPRESEFYIVVVFRSGGARDQFLKDHGLPDDRYQSGQHLEMLIRGEEIPAAPAPEKATKSQARHDRALDA